MIEPKFKTMGKFLNKIYPKNVIGTTLFPFGIYIRDKWQGNIKVKWHESIHWAQQIEMFFSGIGISVIGLILFLLFNVSVFLYPLLIIFPFLFFYLWYVLEWLIKTVIHFKGAYRDISFEREAYGNEKFVDYLKKRKSFYWMRFIFKP